MEYADGNVALEWCKTKENEPDLFGTTEQDQQFRQQIV
jgi:hypothetical protein